MLKTKNIITRFEEVDEAWAFKFYLNLSETPGNESINLLSPFREERTPSFFLFYEDRWFFKCYSSNLGGDIYDFVRHFFGYKNKAEAVWRVFLDYQGYLQSNNLDYTLTNNAKVVYTGHKRYKVTGYELRKWNTDDVEFWGKYGVGSDLLKEHYVSPLYKVIMAKSEEDIITIERPLLYGYFSKNGDIYKIYQPGNKVAKYIKINNYIQGTDQLSATNENLLITKALKDILGFKALKIPNWDSIAPDSENSLIPKEHIDQYKKRYKKIVTLFDNDDAGTSARNLYKEAYGFDALPFKTECKDLTDSVVRWGQTNIKNYVIKELNKIENQ